jgi:hypothetical protein
LIKDYDCVINYHPGKANAVTHALSWKGKIVVANRDHVVVQPTHKDIKFLEKPSKSGLIGVWHKDNLYLGTNIIENEKPLPNKYWFTNGKYKNDATKLVILW